MAGKTIIAPEYTDVEGPLIFLAGPIMGAYNWQKEAIAIIQKNAPEINIASPRRDLAKDCMPDGDFSEEIYNEQVDWETHYLQRAGKDGMVLFWLAKEFKHACERAYAQTTRAELFEWKVYHQVYGAKLAVGIEEGFTGARYIKRRFSQDCPDIPVCNSLEETCMKAIEKVN